MTDLGEAMSGSDVVMIAVGTPALPDGKSNLSYIRQAASDVAAHLSDTYTVMATMSTVPVGTGSEIERIVATKAPGLAESGLVDVVSNPEFLREGSAIHDRLHPERIVVGAQTSRAAEKMAELYEPFNAKRYLVDRATAELAKYACNAFLATKISFINEISNICENVGADVMEIAKIMGDDSRIGPHFLQAGLGYGGSCFPKDTRALDQIANHHDHDFDLLKAVIEVNNRQRQRLMEKIVDRLAPLQGKKLAVLGLAFKPDTDDLREAPAISIINELLEQGAIVTAHDPVAAEKAQPLVPGASCTADLRDALTGADALVIVTDWPIYKELDLNEAKSLMNQPLIFDGRNVLEPNDVVEVGFTYYGVGRSASRRSSVVLD